MVRISIGGVTCGALVGKPAGFSLPQFVCQRERPLARVKDARILNCRMLLQMTALGLSWLLPIAVWADDWPQWRGPNRDGAWNGNLIQAHLTPQGNREISRARLLEPTTHSARESAPGLCPLMQIVMFLFAAKRSWFALRSRRSRKHPFGHFDRSFSSRSCDRRSIQVAGYSFRSRSKTAIASAVRPLLIRAFACLNSSSPIVSARPMIRPASC